MNRDFFFKMCLRITYQDPFAAPLNDFILFLEKMYCKKEIQLHSYSSTSDQIYEGNLSDI